MSWTEQGALTDNWTAQGALTDNWTEMEGTEAPIPMGIIGDDGEYIRGDDGEIIIED